MCTTHDVLGLGDAGKQAELQLLLIRKRHCSYSGRFQTSVFRADLLFQRCVLPTSRDLARRTCMAGLVRMHQGSAIVLVFEASRRHGLPVGRNV